MPARVLVLGAGFGGLELSTVLSETLGDAVEVTLLDRNDSFVFGYSKLDVVFGRATVADVRHSYRSVDKPGVCFARDTIVGIDPVARRTTTTAGEYEADFLVIALGAEYDLDATPGLREHGCEFYSVAGVERAHRALTRFERGHVIVGVCDATFKCPPAPSECALLLHDYLAARGTRHECDISLVMPFDTPVPSSPDTSRAIAKEFAERNVTLIARRRVRSVASRSIVLDDGSERACDLMLGVPVHRAPGVVRECGLLKDGWIPVHPRNLETRFSNVFAIGDVANMQTPKAGVFAEEAARSVATTISARLGHRDVYAPYTGAGSCYVDFGRGRSARVDVDYYAGESPSGKFQEPTEYLRGEKEASSAKRRARWFGGAPVVRRRSHAAK